jgi:beta-lactamase regulating signal transducer with metallopeptidase domain
MTQWLADTLIATTALLALVMILRKPVARHFGAGIAYGLWILPAARLFMPSLTREISLPSYVGKAVINTVPMETITATPVASGPSIDWTVILITLWLGGAALLLVIQTLRYCTMRDALLADAIMLDQIGDITVIECEDVPGPLAFGLFHRYIAVPKNFSSVFAPRERELALAHEVAHHRAGDLFANLAAFLFLCLQWFNPLAWIAWNAFRLDQEAACDARVLAGADADTRLCYGHALARTANDGMTSFAMALNSPRTIIERLRRVMMEDPSKGRRLAGRFAILLATAVALPLTATVVPVFAEDGAKTDDGAQTQKRKMIIIKSSDGKPVTVDVKGDEDTPFVKTIEKDGKTIVLRSNKELDEAEIQKLVAEAEQSRGEAEAAAGEAEAAAGEAEAAAGAAEAARGEAEAARGQAEADRATRRVIRIKRSDGKTMAWTNDSNMHSDMVPEIDISEVDANCNGGDVMSTNVYGYDGDKKARVKIVMCGKGQAKLARVHAIQGLKEAQAEMKTDKDIPDSVRKSVIDSLQQQINRLEKEQSENKDAS